MIFSNLPSLQSFKIGNYSFYSTTSLSLSSMIIKFDNLIFSDLPKLNQISLGIHSFNKTTSISLQSTFKFSISSISRCSFQQWKIFCCFRLFKFHIPQNHLFFYHFRFKYYFSLSFSQIASESLKQAILTIRPK